jgi:hypothetical protein
VISIKVSEVALARHEIFMIRKDGTLDHHIEEKTWGKGKKILGRGHCFW